MQTDELRLIVDNLADFGRMPGGINKLRAAILDAAFAGRLVSSDSSDGTGLELLEQIRAVRPAHKGGIAKRAVQRAEQQKMVFDELPSTWAVASIIDVADVATGRTPKTNVHSNYGGDVPFIGPGQLGGGQVSEGTKWLTAAGADMSVTAQPGTTLFVCIGGTIGKAALVSSPVCFNQQITSLAPVDGVDSGFLFHYVRSRAFQDAVAALTAGGATPIINAGRLASLPFPLPPSKEQADIAQRIDELFELVAKLESARYEEQQCRRELVGAAFRELGRSNTSVALDEMDELLQTVEDVDALERAVLKLAVSGQLVPQVAHEGDARDMIELFEAQVRHKGERNSTGFSEPVLFEIPPSWAWSTLGVVGTIAGGGTPRSDRDGAFVDNPEEGIPWYTPADLGGSRSMYAGAPRRWLSDVGLKSSSAQVLPTGAVLFSSRAPIGYVAILKEAAATNQGFKSLVPREGLLSEFVYFWLRYRAPAIDAAAPSTTFREVNKRSMEKELIPIPPTAEQQRIVDRVLEMLPRIRYLRDSIAA